MNVIAESRKQKAESRKQKAEKFTDSNKICQYRELFENSNLFTGKGLQRVQYRKSINERSNCNSIIFYGNLTGKNIQGYTYSVYGVDGLCATITTCCGGGREPLILIK